MSRPVILSRRARAEFDDAADWYERQKPGLGLTFSAAVRRMLLNLPSQAELHPEVHEDIREALVSRYPYAIYYRPEADRISVIAVFHTSRDPVEWKVRE